MDRIIPFGNRNAAIKEASEQLYATNRQISLKEKNGAKITDADIDKYFEAAADLLNEQDLYNMKKLLPHK